MPLSAEQISNLGDQLFKRIQGGETITFNSFKETDASYADVTFDDYSAARQIAERKALGSWGLGQDAQKRLSRSSWNELPAHKRSEFIQKDGVVFDDPAPAIDRGKEMVTGFGGKELSRGEWQKLSPAAQSAFFTEA